MKIAVTGAKGCIGQRLVSMGATPLSCDVTVRYEVWNELITAKPDIVVHCAAISSADECEKDYERAISVNVFGTNTVCEMAEKAGAKTILLSSDQVFDGKEGEYKEDDIPNPIHDYGRTKLGAEGIAQLYDAKILRISRCFYSQSKDISEYLLRLENNIEIEVPYHIYRSYCHMDYIAKGIWEYAKRFEEMPEVLHLAGSHPVSFFDFMRLVADEYGYNADLVSPRGEENGYASRPLKCGLSVWKATELGLPIFTPQKSIERMKNEGL